MRLMGLDVGERRIGVAVGDPIGLLATPLTVLRRDSRERDFRSIKQLADQYEVSQVVVGLPRRLDGSLGTQAQKVKAFARELEREVGLEVILCDERFTTVEAEELLIAMGMRPAKRREVIDAAAAALVLQRYLDSRQLA